MISNHWLGADAAKKPGENLMMPVKTLTWLRSRTTDCRKFDDASEDTDMAEKPND